MKITSLAVERVLRLGLTVVALVVVLVHALWVHMELSSQLDVRGGDMADFSLSVPALERAAPSAEGLAACNQALWGLKPLEDTAPVVEEAGDEAANAPALYAVKQFGDVEGIYNRNQQSQRWLFYGITRVGDRPRAVFYQPEGPDNPWLLVEPGMELAPGLTMGRIGEHELLVRAAAPASADGELALSIFQFTGAKP